MERDTRICPICRTEVERINMYETKDCHGIYMRLVCEKCWRRIMEKGYDGVYYTDLDEQIEADY